MTICGKPTVVREDAAGYKIVLEFQEAQKASSDLCQSFD